MKLRPAIMEDAKFLFDLKNDPVVREYSIVTHNKIKWKDHLQWLKKHLHEIQIIESDWDYKPYGDIRIEGNEIAIKLDSEHRGKGIGYWLLAPLVKKGMTAKIVNENISSIRLFIKLGFKPTIYDKKGYYIFKL